MQNTAEFLDALRAKLKLPSDGQLADYLGMHRQHLSRYRTLGGTFDDEMSLRVAEILEIDGAYVMTCMHYQRAKNPEVKAAWKHTAEILYGLAAALALVAILPTVPLDYDGFNVAFLGMAEASFVYYVKSLADVLAAYWYLALPLVWLAFRHFPRHNPRPKN